MKRLLSLFLCLACSMTILLVSYPTVSAAESIESESRYSLDIQPLGGAFVGDQNRKVYYTYKTHETYINPYEAPCYIPSASNACAVESGGNSIAYFDRLYDELIPGYKHKYIFGGFSYGAQNAAVDSMFAELYSLMGTTSSGTTIQGFKNGLSAYVYNKGRTPQIISAVGDYYNTNINYIKSQLEQEKLAVIFLDTFSITGLGGIEIYDGYDLIYYSVYTGCHTMLVYGYTDIYYYDANWNLVTRDTYFFASTGFNGARLALINMRDFCQIDDVYIINIL